MFSTGLLYAGGYVLGMAIAGLLLNRMQSTWSKYLLAMVITYITGASWLHFAFGFNFVRCIAPYLLHEAIKVAGIYGIQRAMR